MKDYRVTDRDGRGCRVTDRMCWRHGRDGRVTDRDGRGCRVTDRDGRVTERMCCRDGRVSERMCLRHGHDGRVTGDHI